MDELERQLGILSERFNFIEQENFRLRERLSQYEMVDNFIGTYKSFYIGENMTGVNLTADNLVRITDTIFFRSSFLDTKLPSSKL